MKGFNEKDARHVELNVNDYVLHGDVIITKVGEIKDFEKMKKLSDNVLAEGEITGHCHKLFSEDDIDLREDLKTKTKHLRLVTSAFLKHQEHAPIVLPPGKYKIGIQREYDHFEEMIREVAD